MISPFPGGGLQDFRPGLSSSSSSHVPAGISEGLVEPGEGVFGTFHQNKKVRRPHPPASVSPSTPACSSPAVGHDHV